MDCGQGLPEKWQETAEETLAVQEDLISKWHGSAGGRIRVWFALRTIFNVSDRLIQMTNDLAAKYGVGIHMHVAEAREEVNYARENRGNTTVKHLVNLGALGGRLLAVHSVWLDEEEIDLFAHHDVKVSHCPAAGMKVLGFARIPEMLDKGICISIGTDGAPCNNRMDIISDMYLASLIHKGRTLNPETLPAERILELATVNGAKCLLWEDEIGSLEPGKKADLIIINPAAAGSIPVHDPVANLVYAVQSANVESSMCDGRWLIRNRKIMTVNEEEVLRQAGKRAAALALKAGIRLPERFPVIKIR